VYINFTITVEKATAKHCLNYCTNLVATTVAMAVGVAMTLWVANGSGSRNRNGIGNTITHYDTNLEVILSHVKCLIIIEVHFINAIDEFLINTRILRFVISRMFLK
jgi:hypothetical protein